MPLAAALLCLVVGVTDGDTMTLRCDDGTVKVRLAEIDAPERGQPWGERSRQSLAALCFQQRAELRQRNRDRYGRAVGRVACTGHDASQAQVDAGLAWAYVRYLTDPAIDGGERAARANRRGLWQDAEPVEPWLWRRVKRTDKASEDSRHSERSQTSRPSAARSVDLKFVDGNPPQLSGVGEGVGR